MSGLSEAGDRRQSAITGAISLDFATDLDASRQSRFRNRLPDLSPEEPRERHTFVSCTSRLCGPDRDGVLRRRPAEKRRTLDRRRESLANDASRSLPFEGMVICRHGTARHATAPHATSTSRQQRRSEHDDDASALASSSPANWLHLRRRQLPPSASLSATPGAALLDSHEPTRKQLRPLATTTVADAIRQRWIGQDQDTRA